MEIVEKRIADLKPYTNNPRYNDQAVEYVANSIQEFGFKVPIIIDKENVIVAGHTRYKACKLLNIRTVPCIVADDLTDEQVRAFRLADNKVSEVATYNEKALEEELAAVLEIDMEQFGFEVPDFDEPDVGDGYFGDERERTFDGYNLNEFDPAAAEGFYQMPIIRPCNVIPSELVGFNYVLNTEPHGGVHFYIDDYQFERIWNRPYEYLQKLDGWECVLTPDFSLYLDMSMSMKIWNVFRSRLVGQIMQRFGLNVIPTVSWAEEETFDFCFDGLPHEATLSISTVGVKQDPLAADIWEAGMDAMIERLNPKTLLVYGGALEYDYKDIQVINYSNAVTDRMKESKKKSPGRGQLHGEKE